MLKINIVKMMILFVLTYYSNIKLTDRKITFDISSTYKLVFLILNSIICGFIRYTSNYFISIIYSIIIISIIFDNSNLKVSMISTIISISINFILNLISTIICFPLLNWIFEDKNIFIDIIVIAPLRLFFLSIFFKIKRLKHGIIYLKNNRKEDYVDTVILNVSVTIVLSIIIFASTNPKYIASNMGVQLILLAILSIISFKKSFDLYYKQKLLVQELNETKEELNKKNEEIAKLEEENLSFSKKSHSLAHKQKALEYKLNQLMMKTETAEEIKLKEKLNTISNELYTEPELIELSKTEIPEVDDMLNYMQSECKKNKIDFDLQITGNIYKMINNYITKEELEILLADHIKDAIIAINHTDNINKSILVRLGKIDEIYGLYIYDSGIEFEPDTLKKLGKEPITTHKNEGGTGMGFMNTFETIRKHKASLIIKEIGKPSKENYTKAIIIKFDNKNEFKIETYKK